METTHPTPGLVDRELDVARTVDDAACYLDCYGWCQGELYQTVHGRFPRACALGAIYLVTFHTPVTTFEAVSRDDDVGVHARLVICEFADYLDDGIYRNDDTPAEVVWNFNDHPDATDQLVTRAFRAAATRYRSTLDA